MKNNKSLSGFTLVELVIVIVILAVLSVVAAPRFLDLSDDARQAQLSKLATDLSSSANLIYARSVIAGTTEIGVDSSIVNLYCSKLRYLRLTR
ncbi:prepilin-type N-terminal cleavage/methylation domain-containing protein [Glaciecola sp. MH2013]|uniref:type II secretion system protein n=1 Tax=Glaciecola sp. MH2013 TaxID=2785524 RepID=UPI0018A087EB|nr:prepilin-type N-terminal cleavage/methylation domain-containing protein [Glaciecola sp. MH2013]MBF7071784.1 prepilin-type N-terminal cleavage/methylation domain-containing protein [Glaciecola sp. MH2013]